MSRKTWIMLKRGLVVDPKHREALGIRIWLYLYILDRTNWAQGAVLEWRDRDAADEMEMPLTTLRKQRVELEVAGYIRCQRVGNKQRMTVPKWVNPREYSGEVYNPPDLAGDEDLATAPQGVTMDGDSAAGIQVSPLESPLDSPLDEGNPAAALNELKDSHITDHQEQDQSRVGLSKAEQDAVRKTVEEHFKALTSLTVPPNKKEAGELWWAPLREICALVDWVPGIGIELLAVCVQRAKQNRTEIASPKSIIKYARSIRAAQLRGEPIGLGGNGRPGNARQGYDPAADMAAFKNRRGLK